MRSALVRRRELIHDSKMLTISPNHNYSIINHNYPIIIVNPHIGTESDTKADPKEYGSIPMDENKNVKDHTGNAKSIWKICSGLSFFKEFSHPSPSEDTI